MSTSVLQFELPGGRGTVPEKALYRMRMFIAVSLVKQTLMSRRMLASLTGELSADGDVATQPERMSDAETAKTVVNKRMAKLYTD